MARFYLHLVEQDRVVADGEGIDRPDLAAAIRAAIDAARDVMAADVLAGQLDLHGRIEVVGTDGTMLAMVRFAEAVMLTPPRCG